MCGCPVPDRWLATCALLSINESLPWASEELCSHLSLSLSLSLIICLSHRLPAWVCNYKVKKHNLPYLLCLGLSSAVQKVSNIKLGYVKLSLWLQARCGIYLSVCLSVCIYLFIVFYICHSIAHSLLLYRQFYLLFILLFYPSVILFVLLSCFSFCHSSHHYLVLSFFLSFVISL